MVSALIVGVAGTHSTGKSTFCEELKHTLETKGVKVATIPSFGRLAVEQGIPLLTQHTYDSTMWFIDRTLEAQGLACSSAEVVLVDRPILDALAYWNAATDFRQAPASTGETERVYALVSGRLQEYCAIVATKLDTSIPLGPKRDNNLLFRELVDSHLHRLLESQAISHQLLTPAAKGSLMSSLSNQLLSQLGYK